MTLPEIAASLFVPITVILMILGFLLSLIPILPGSLVVWFIALAAALIDGFQQISTGAFVLMTIIMAVSQLSDFWLPLFGVKTGGMSCAASLGAFVGGLLGTFLIPIPLLGTLIGTVAGALMVEYVQRGQMETAVRAGEQAARLFAIGYGIRILSSLAIVIIYVISLAVGNF